MEEEELIQVLMSAFRDHFESLPEEISEAYGTPQEAVADYLREGIDNEMFMRVLHRMWLLGVSLGRKEIEIIEMPVYGRA